PTASTTYRPSRAPIASASTPSSQTSDLGPGSRATTRNPSAVLAAPAVAPAAGARTGATRSAETSATPAITANTVPAPPAPRSTPASAGAARTLTLSIQPEATLAAVSSSGVRASDGVRTACAGRVIVT